jgi:effector-binding domain-containing protein
MLKNFFNGRYFIERSTVIEKPAKVVFQKIRDLKTWNSWSPWVLHEPDIKMEFSKNSEKEGGSYQWDGKLIGAGKVTHEKLIEHSAIEQKIEFFKPFKSVCKIGWRFVEQGKNKTQVSWSMEGKMPFLFRFMIPKMKKEIGADYEFGLTLLKGELDPKAHSPKISFTSESHLESQKFLVTPYKGNLKELPKEMHSAYSNLMKYIEKSGFQMIKGVCIYYKVNPKTGAVICDFALQVEGEGDAGEFALKTLPAQKYFQTTLKGDYSFLGIAWGQAFTHLKMIKKNFDWKKPSLEVYVKDPRTIKNPNDYLTDLYVPIK